MLVALSGKMKSGKTTLAKTITRDTIYSFADPIRAALRELGIDKTEHPMLYRQGAQYIGTDLCRAHDPDWWVQRMARRFSYRPIGKHFVIDDMRFQNEYDWCKEQGFLMVRLDISRELQYTRGAEEGTFDHPSETGLDHIPREEWDVWLDERSSPTQRALLVWQAHVAKDQSLQIGSTIPIN